MSDNGTSFFSISFELILINSPLPYDIYVNSSSNIKKERYVRIYPKDETISEEDLKKFKKKYFQLYVHESQRDLYLRSIVKNLNVNNVKKTEVIKESAILYLDKLFDDDKEFTTAMLSDTIHDLKNVVESMVDVLKDYDVAKLQGLIANLSFHDFYTYDHSINVGMYCIAIYSAAKPNAHKTEIVMAGLGGLLHDIGKIKIPTEIINNPGKLSPLEFDMIKKHPKFGFDLLVENPCECEGVDFNLIKRIIKEHHENFNGSGYPNSLVGFNIHLLARIAAIADFFDAITTKRSYHEVLPIDEAINVMAQTVGKKLDPDLFKIFTQSVKQVVSLNKIDKVLPSDYDPCQPQNVLPFQKADPNFKIENFSIKEEDSSFGKIKIKA